MLEQKIWAELYLNRAEIARLKEEREQMFNHITILYEQLEEPPSSPNLLETLSLEKALQKGEKQLLKFIWNFILSKFKKKEKDNE